MKKRKSPIMLVTLLVVLLGGATLLSASLLTPKDPEAMQQAAQQEQQEELGEQRPETTAEDIKTNVMGSMSEALMAESGGPKPPTNTSQPLIQNNKPEFDLPKPSDGMPYGHWYRADGRGQTEKK